MCMQLGCWSGSCEKGKRGKCCEENVWPQVMDYWKPLPGDYSSVTNLLYSSQQVCFTQCFRYSLHKPAIGGAGYNEGMNNSSLYSRINTSMEPRNESSVNFHPHVIQNLHVIYFSWTQSENFDASSHCSFPCNDSDLGKLTIQSNPCDFYLLYCNLSHTIALCNLDAM